MEENSADLALRGGGAFGDFGAVALDLLLGASHANVGINAREGENFKPIPNIWRGEILLNSDNSFSLLSSEGSKDDQETI